MTVRAEVDPDHPAGHALIWVTGAATAVGTPGFRVQRDAGWGDDKLGSGGWQGSDALLQPDGAEARGSDLMLRVGWNVCRYLEAGVYEFSVPSAGLAQMGLSWPDIVPQHAGTSRPPELPAAPTTALPTTGLPMTGLIDPPAPKLMSTVPPPDAPAALPSGMVKSAMLAASLAALLLGAGVYYWLHREPDRTELAEAPAPEPTPTQVATGLGGLSVPDVLTRAPNPAAIAAEGQQRLRSDRRDDGLLLLEAAADRADPAAAAALGRLYDPVLFQPGGPIPRPDPRQAARYYRDAARGGADVADAREALRQNLQARVQAGDLGATLNLKDFWP
jgi:hypothetical protein